MTAAGGVTLEAVLGTHLPRNVYDDDGAPTATMCTCGGWSGGYFADGEQGPFDDHLAAEVRRWLAGLAGDVGVREAVFRATLNTCDDHYQRVTDNAVGAFLRAAGVER